MTEESDLGTMDVPNPTQASPDSAEDKFVDTIVYVQPQEGVGLEVSSSPGSPEGRFVDRATYGGIVPFLSTVAERFESNLIQLHRETEHGVDNAVYNHLIKLTQLTMGVYVAGIFAKNLSARGARSLLVFYKTPQAVSEVMKLSSEHSTQRDRRDAYLKAYELVHNERLDDRQRKVLDAELILPFENGEGKGTIRKALYTPAALQSEFHESELEKAVEVGSSAAHPRNQENFDRLMFVSKNLRALMTGTQNPRLGHSIELGDTVFSGFPVPTPSSANIDPLLRSQDGYGMIAVEGKYINAQFKSALFAAVLKSASLTERLGMLERYR